MTPNSAGAAGTPLPTAPQRLEPSHLRDDQLEHEPSRFNRQSVATAMAVWPHGFRGLRLGLDECAHCGLPAANRRHDRDERPARDGAIAGVTRAAVAADDTWWRAAWRALEHLADGTGVFDAWALTELGVPDPDHPGRWGALFRQAHTRGLIVPVGYRPSKRPGRAGGACRTWRGAK